MLGFDLKERFKKMYEQYYSGDLRREEKRVIESEFGDDLDWFKRQDEKTQKEIYCKLQVENKKNKLENCPQVLTSYDDMYFLLYSDADFDEMIKYYKQENFKDVINVDDEILGILSNLSYLKRQDLTNPSVKKKMVGCYDMIKQHIKNGYNIYPLIKLLNKNVEEHKKHFPKGCEKGGIYYDNIISDMNAVQTLELLEMHSPYAQFINASNQMGELIREQKDLEEQEKYDEADKVGDKIEKLKDQIRTRLKSYDLDFLEDFLNDRKNYLRKYENKLEEYLGSMEVLKTVVFYNKSQQKETIKAH